MAEKEIRIHFKKLSKHAKNPLQESLHAPGLSLFSAECKVITSMATVAVKTDLSLTIPDGSYGRIAPKSSNNPSLNVLAGICDSDASGNLMILLFNAGDEDILVNVGSKITELIIARIFMVKLVETMDSIEYCDTSDDVKLEEEREYFGEDLSNSESDGCIISPINPTEFYGENEGIDR